MATVWKILNCFDGKKPLDIGCFAIMILNRPVSVPKKHILNFWNKASYRATVDGGTDRWYEFVSSLSNENSDPPELKKIHPDLVSGDFDSVKPETLQKCKKNSVKIINTPDQDKTDFSKALEEIWRENNGQLDSVIAVVDNSGRLDHIMSNLNTLFESLHHHLYLLGSDSVTWLLTPGLHHILVPHSLVEAKVSCGLIPIGHPSTVTTTGLKWNLDKDKMQFGGLISSCNTYSEDYNGLVTVETDGPLLWTTTLATDDSS